MTTQKTPQKTPRLLVLTHGPGETVGRLGPWLESAGAELVACRPWDGDEVPASASAYDGLVVMGGKMQAYDESSTPWLRATKDLLARAVADQTPTLAVCLGAQLLAEATGGTVEPGEDGPELGARLVAKRDKAGVDPLVWDTPMSWICLQWHWDVITELPPGATLLASSTKYPHQMFRLGEKAWGTQFHVEPDEAMLTRWATEDADGVREVGLDPERLLARGVAELDEVADLWEAVAGRFVAVTRGQDPRPVALPMA